MNMKKITIVSAFIFSSSILSHAQGADTVIINIGDSSKVTFEIKNQKDLQTLKKYDLQAVVNDMIIKLEKRDTTMLDKSSQAYVKETTDAPVANITGTEENWNTSWKERDRKSYQRHRTYQSLNFDVGTNNYLANGKFPDENNDPYAIKPWGSWYIGVNSIQRTRLARTFFLEWGGGVSWYNFKFQDKQTAISKDDNMVTFLQDQRDVDFKKSKLTACYLNLSLVPVLDFGANRRKAMFFDGHHSESVRFGIGPYVGYRIDSYTKQVFKEDGDKHKERNHDSFYLDNIRYGLRFQFGFRDVDIFFNYDMNELFVDNKGPKLNAFSFGITL
jgi:hypothetical protein